MIEDMIAADHPEYEDHEREWGEVVAEIDEEVEEEFAEEYERHNSVSGDALVGNDLVEEAATSYLQAHFDSEEMRALLRNIEEEETHNISVKNFDNNRYRAQKVFPEWLLKSKEWKLTKGAKKENQDDVSETLRTAPAHRTAEQQTQLVYWIMSVWPTAEKMGVKKCNQMLQEFKYISYEPEENIITEGEPGMTFYIIISGETAVHKAGIGVVAKLGKGKSFGELALTKGDVRTASIKTITRCEVLSLHKLDYDHFIKDIQQAERREHFHLVRECPLFAKWTRSKIDKVVNSCTRKMFDAGATIFSQGDPPDSLYIVMDGVVEIVKEVIIVCKNRWPTAMQDWEYSSKRTVKPIRVSVQRRGGYFGELAIVRNSLRAATAICQTKVVLVCVDKLEFMHLINQSKTSELEPLTRGAKAYPSDDEILGVIGHISGGPQSRARLGDVVIMPNKIEKLVEVDPRAATRLGEKVSEMGSGGLDKNKSQPNKQKFTAQDEHLRKENRELMQAKFAGVAQQATSEASELAEARRQEELVAASIERSARHGAVEPRPLSHVEKLLARELSHKSLCLVRDTQNRKPFKAEIATGGGSVSLLKAGMGSYAAALDPLDRVVFAPKIMMDKPKGPAVTVRLPEFEVLPLVGVVTSLRRVPEGTFLRRLGSPQLNEKRSGTQQSLKPRHNILRPTLRPRPEKVHVSTRDFLSRPNVSYRDAIER